MSPPADRPALRHYLILYAAAALWTDFAHVHEKHNADTLIFSLASLYAWTPFFWQQDRVGMLLPLLTSWCPDPLATTLMLTWGSVFLGLAAPLLAAEVVCPHPVGRGGATLASALMLALAPDRIRENLLLECFYPQAMALGCAGLLVLARGGDRPRLWRYPVAAGLFGLVHWVYVGAAVWLMPLALWVAVLRPGVPAGTVREATFRLVRYFPGWVSLLLLFGAFLLGMWFMEQARAGGVKLILVTPAEGLPRDQWAESWRGFAEALARMPGMTSWARASLALAAVGVVGLVGLTLRRAWPAYPVLSAAVALALAGATEYLFMGTRDWVAQNFYHPRYVLGAIESASLVLALVAVAPLAGWAAGRGRWVVFGCAAGLLFAATTDRYGFPLPGRPRADLDARFGAYTADLRAANVDAVAGRYWVVWPTVYHAGLAGMPGSPPVYGIGYRSDVFRRRWERTHPDGMRVAVPADPTDRQELFDAAREHGLTEPTKIGTHGRLEIYFTRPVAGPAAGGD